jgi:hypothetical protein
MWCAREKLKQNKKKKGIWCQIIIGANNVSILTPGSTNVRCWIHFKQTRLNIHIKT